MCDPVREDTNLLALGWYCTYHEVPTSRVYKSKITIQEHLRILRSTLSTQRIQDTSLQVILG
jgi:hypothetical protein